MLEKKQQREVLARIRQASVARERVTLRYLGQEANAFLIDAIDEVTVRGIDEDRGLHLTPTESSAPSQPSGTSRAALELPWRHGLLRIEGEVVAHANASKSLRFAFKLSAVESVERRSIMRHDACSEFPMTLLLWQSGGECHVREAWLRDESADHISFRLEAEKDYPEAPTRPAEICEFVDERSLWPSMRRCTVEATRTERDDVVIIARKEPLKARELLTSLLQLPEGSRIQFKRVDKLTPAFDLGILRVYTDGFLATRPIGHELPEEIELLLEHLPTGLRFRALRNTGGVWCRLQQSSIGDRLQWYNCLIALRGEQGWGLTSSQIASLTSLMVEAGSVDLRGLRRRTRRSAYYEHRVNLESVPPRTKSRLYRLDEDGEVSGHASMLRASRTLWGAVDNIGSSRFAGRWNRDAIAPWLRLMAEIFRGRGYGFLWTFRPDHGVWTAFDEQVASNPELVSCRHEVLVLFIGELPREVNARASDWSMVEDPRDSSTFLRLERADQFLISGLWDGPNETDSDFQSDMVRDYGMPLRRVYADASLPSGARVLVTASNNSEWTTINALHNSVCVFRDPSSPRVTPEDEGAVLSLAFNAAWCIGAQPRSIMAFNFGSAFPSWPKWVNMIVSADALDVAATFAERT